MKDINDILKNFERGKRPNSERAALLSLFIERLDKNAGERYKKNGKWYSQKKVSPRYIAVKLAHLSLDELYYFFSMCKSSKSGFEKCFYGALKNKAYPQVKD